MVPLITAKLSYLSAEGERIRVRFAVVGDGNTMGDILLPASHPAVPNLRVGATYRLSAEEITVSPQPEG